MLFSHFLELKNRSILVFTCFLGSFFVSYLYKEVLVFLLVKIVVQKNKVTLFYFISTKISDVFSVYLDISYFLSTQLMVLILFYQILAFIAPGLFYYEYRKVRNVWLISLNFTFLSVWLVNVYVLPYLWYFFFSFSAGSTKSVNIFFEASIVDYLIFYKYIYYRFICMGQVFGLVFIVLNSVKDKVKFILSTRKSFYLMFLLISTFLTPPEVFSQLVTVSLLFFFFEVIMLYGIFRKYTFYLQKIVIIIFKILIR